MISKNKKFPVAFFSCVDQEIRFLSERISLARRKRGLTQAQMAERTNLSIATYRRIEAGDSNVAFGSICRVIFALNGLPQLKLLLSPQEDFIGFEKMQECLPKRVRHSKKESFPKGF